MAASREKTDLSTAADGRASSPCRCAVIALVVAVGCGLSVCAFTVVQNWGRRQVELCSREQARDGTGTHGRSVRTSLREARTVAGFVVPFVLSVFRFGRLLAEIVACLEVGGTDVCVANRPAPLAPQFVSFHSPGTGHPSAQPVPAGPAVFEQGLSHPRAAEMTPRQAPAIRTSALEALPTVRSWILWAVLGIVLLLTGVLAARASLMLARAKQSRRFAEELLRSHRHLEEEIAECQRAELALRESVRNYRILLENLPQRIFLKDRTSVYMSCNEHYAGDLGIRAAEIVGKTDYEFYPKELAEKYRVDDKRVMESGATEDIEEKYIREGKEVWVHTVKTPVREEDGTVAGVLGIFWDVSESKRAEQERQRAAERLELLNRELERSNRDFEEFTQTVSHDLQEPLRKICTFGEFLAEDLGERLPESAREHLRKMQDAAVRMQGLVRHLLGLARVGTAGREPVAVAAGMVVDKVLETLSERVRESGADITVAAELPRVMADPVQLEQVFQNLLSNALKFRSPERQPRITIGATREGEQVRFAVSDNGIGIDERFFERIFGMFQRLLPREQYEGAGVGLALSAKIVRRHGGRIWVESEVGTGSTFYFTLPAFPGDQGGNP